MLVGRVRNPSWEGVGVVLGFENEESWFEGRTAKEREVEMCIDGLTSSKRKSNCT